MYSPKIDEELIPVLYRMAKSRGISMKQLTNELLESALSGESTRALRESTDSVNEPEPEQENPND